MTAKPLLKNSCHTISLELCIILSYSKGAYSMILSSIQGSNLLDQTKHLCHDVAEALQCTLKLGELQRMLSPRP